MKRLFILLLSVATLLTVLPLAGAAVADDTPAVAVSSAEGTAGSTVSVSISLSDNPGIAAFRFKLQYDSDLLELTEAEFPKLLSSPAAGGMLTANPYIISWYSTGSRDETENGAFAILTFRIKDGAKPGDTPLRISYDQVDLCDRNLRDVTLATVDGTISVLPEICEHQWDVLGIRCEKCGEQKLIGSMQERYYNDRDTKDFRILLETTPEIFLNADYVELTLTFRDKDGVSLRDEPIVAKLTTVYKTVYADGKLQQPEVEGNYLCGLVVTGIPLSIGVKYVTASATFAKDDIMITYELGTATLP